MNGLLSISGHNAVLLGMEYNRNFPPTASAEGGVPLWNVCAGALGDSTLDSTMESDMTARRIAA